MMMPIIAKMLSRVARDEQAADRADERHRQRQHDRERVHEAAELRGQHHVDQDDRPGTARSPGLANDSAMISRLALEARSVNPSGRPDAPAMRVDVLDGGPERLALQVRVDHDLPLPRLVIDLRRPGVADDARQVAELHDRRPSGRAASGSRPCAGSFRSVSGSRTRTSYCLPPSWNLRHLVAADEQPHRRSDCRGAHAERRPPARGRCCTDTCGLPPS